MVNSRDGGIKVQWQKDPTVRNEALDVRFYARAAAHLFGLDDPTKNWKLLENKVKQKQSIRSSISIDKNIQDIISQNQLNDSFI